MICDMIEVFQWPSDDVCALLSCMTSGCVFRFFALFLLFRFFGFLAVGSSCECVACSCSRLLLLCLVMYFVRCLIAGGMFMSCSVMSEGSGFWGICFFVGTVCSFVCSV